MADPTLEQILAELTRGETNGFDGYLTAHEWAARLGVPHSRLMRVLCLAHAQGKLASVRKLAEAVDGSRRYVPAYRFVLGGE